ncbi:PepSY domain-containing protein [Caldalkalibacillus salinus]|uniref:PepSY domain-containing protein n=1 Tax=Caldalkalibacillus salinus TaxID=2803787 RepID=UPI001923B1A4|nr:PepSY domain-containing protein [Caldalkalibacillus salinus]
MKLGRFLLGVAAGLTASYVLNRASESQYVKPEKIVQEIKGKYKHKMEIVGSWIHVEPISEERSGIHYHVYQGGLTGMVNDQPAFVEFKVDADTGTILEVETDQKNEQ